MVSLFLAAREKELQKTQQEKKKLAEKLSMLEGKLIVGGVDLVSVAILPLLKTIAFIKTSGPASNRRFLIWAI